MPTIGQVASAGSTGLGVALPLLTSLSNPVSAAIAGGVGLIALVDKIGQGRKAANKMTGKGGPQDILNKQLGAISASQSTPEEKAQATDKAWRDFLGAANQFATANPKQAQVVKQAIYQTPELTNTVQSLLGKNPLDSSYTDLAAQGMTTGYARPNPGPSVGGTLLRTGLNVGLPFAVDALQGNRALSSLGSPSGGVSITDEMGNVIPNSGSISMPGSSSGGGGSIFSRILSGLGGGATNPGGQQGGGSLLSRLLPQIISGGTSLIGGVIASNAAQKAGQMQSDAAIQAAELQRQAGQDAIGFNREVLDQQQKNLQPWLDAGTGALRSIQDITSKPFELPSYEEAMNDPGIQYALSEGQRVLDASLRSKGLSLSGKAVKETQGRAMNIAQAGYQDVVNRRLQERQANLNPLFSLAGLGQDSTTALNTNMSTAGGRNAEITMSTAANVGNQQTAAAAARAAGTAATGNIWGGVTGQIGSSIMDDYNLQQVLKRIPLNRMG